MKIQSWVREHPFTAPFLIMASVVEIILIVGEIA